MRMNQQHSHNNSEELVASIQMQEKAIKASEQLKMRAVANKGAYEQQLKDNDRELELLGTTSDKAEAELKAIDLEIADIVAEIDQKIPYELLKKYNMLK